MARLGDERLKLKRLNSDKAIVLYGASESMDGMGSDLQDERDYLDTIDALKAEQAELVAGAYLDARQVINVVLARHLENNPNHLITDFCEDFGCSTLAELMDDIYARTPADAKAALDKLLADAKRDVLLEVNRLAEADMLIGNPITGAHHRAIDKVIATIDAAKGGSQQP